MLIFYPNCLFTRYINPLIIPELSKHKSLTIYFKNFSVFNKMSPTNLENRIYQGKSRIKRDYVINANLTKQNNSNDSKKVIIVCLFLKELKIAIILCLILCCKNLFFPD